jgi:large subunit ribosomal protein L1
MADTTAKAAKERQSRLDINKRLREKRSEHKSHSKRFLSVSEKIDPTQAFPLDEAIAKVKESATTKFDSSIEIHLHLNAKKGKKGAEDEYARGVLHLPNGVGKTLKVVVLDEDLIEQIAKTEKINFDVAIATPALMPKMGKVAKILGTKGKMPNPKAGTVTDNPEAIKQEIEAGRIEYRQDAGKNIHQMIGKASWDSAKLKENAEVVMKAFTRNRVASISLSSSMGPGVKVSVE